jgi:hypothetical protein
MLVFNGEIFYSQSEAAKAWNVSRGSVWAKIKSGGIPAFDILGRKMISKDFVDKTKNANFELANGQFFKGWRGKRERVTRTSEMLRERAERVAAKKAKKQSK